MKSWPPPAVDVDIDKARGDELPLCIDPDRTGHINFAFVDTDNFPILNNYRTPSNRPPRC